MERAGVELEVDIFQHLRPDAVTQSYMLVAYQVYSLFFGKIFLRFHVLLLGVAFVEDALNRFRA